MICSYCNGQNRPGSRYKTQYVVGILAETYCIGYAMQPLPVTRVWEERGREDRESEKRLDQTSPESNGNSLEVLLDKGCLNVVLQISRGHFYIAQNRSEEARTDHFSGVHGDGRDASVWMTQENMAAAGSHYFEPESLKQTDKIFSLIRGSRVIWKSAEFQLVQEGRFDQIPLPSRGQWPPEYV